MPTLITQNRVRDAEWQVLDAHSQQLSKGGRLDRKLLLFI